MQGYAVESGVQETRRRLKKAGFKEDDLEAMTEVIAGMEERLATKEDLARAEGVLKQDIADVREDLNQLATTVATHTTRIEGLERQWRLYVRRSGIASRASDRRLPLRWTASEARCTACGERSTACGAKCGRSSGSAAHSSP